MNDILWRAFGELLGVIAFSFGAYYNFHPELNERWQKVWDRILPVSDKVRKDARRAAKFSGYLCVGIAVVMSLLLLRDVSIVARWFFTGIQ